MPPTSSSCYAFGSFQLDPRNRILLRQGARVALTPKAFETLLLLVEGRGDVLTKDQLMATLWPDTFVEEANLTQHVAILRKTLGEVEGAPFIETVPRRGYRFVAPVEIVSSDRPADYVDRPCLAVLPLNLIGTDSADSFLSVSIADTLITKLSHNTRILVRSTNAIIKYDRTSSDPIQIGRLLNVDFVLTGRVYKRVDVFSINLQLVRVNDEVALWSEHFDVTCANVFAIENQLVRKVERSLLPALSAEHRTRTRKRYTHSGAAYRAYLKGRYFWNKRAPEDLWKGIDCFNEAIGFDENYALAYAGLADSYLMLTNYGAIPSRKGFPLVRTATDKALQTDPDLGEAHASLGYLLAANDWDWPGCELEFQRSIELNPTELTPRYWYVTLLTLLGRWDDAREQLEKAREIDPLSLILGAVTGWTLYQMERYEEARVELLKTLDLEQNYYPAHVYLARVAVLQGRIDEAINEFRRALTAFPDNVTILAELAHAQVISGDRTAGRAFLDRWFHQGHRREYVPPYYYLALVYAALEDNDCAFDALARACEEKELWLMFFRCEPRFHSLREDPRYDAIIRRLRLNQ